MTNNNFQNDELPQPSSAEISEAKISGQVSLSQESLNQVSTSQDAPTDPAPVNVDSVNEETTGNGVDAFLNVETLEQKGLEIVQWVKTHLWSIDMALQLGILFLALVPAALLGPRLKSLILNKLTPILPWPILKRAAKALAELATPIALFLTLRIASSVLGGGSRDHYLVDAGISLLSAWIIIRLVTLVIRSPFWSRVAFYVAWPIAAMDAFGLLDNVIGEMEKISFPIGENEVGDPINFSALDGLRVMLIFAVLFWLSGILKRFLAERIYAVDELAPSVKALLNKILGILLPIAAFLIALQLVGFNLATLTIFGGAIGLGVGLGLQKTISNFIAGFTLVADKSITPGNVIEVGNTFGWVTQMGARYVSVRTRDGTEHLVPNDRFIEEGVVNWTHVDKTVRLHAPIGVSYNTKDLRGVKSLCEEAALKVPRVLKNPKPNCNLMEFGDGAIKFDLRFWINDPASGISNVRSEVLLLIWDELKANGIEVPYPQHDLHIKSLPNGLTTPFASS